MHGYTSGMKVVYIYFLLHSLIIILYADIILNNISMMFVYKGAMHSWIYDGMSAMQRLSASRVYYTFVRTGT